MSNKPEPIIQKVGEGRAVAHLPIEIHTSKLLAPVKGSSPRNWLVDRKLVPQLWTKSYTDVRNRFPALLQEIIDLPEVQPLGLTALTYWLVQSVVEILKTANGGKEAAKNFLGQYTSKRMKDWDALQRAYEKDNIFLAESAQFLGSAVNYEIPAMKKTVDKYSKQLTENQRKEGELLRAIENYTAKFASACKELNIPGQDVKAEIQSIATQLSPMFEDFARLARDPGIKRAIDYYALFVCYAQGQSNAEQAAQWPVCDTLLSVHEYGNETVGKYVARKHPNLVPVAADPIGNGSGGTVKEDAPSEIKWDVEETPQAEPQINWADIGISVADSGTEAIAVAAETGEAAPLTINWIEDVSSEPVDVHKGGDEKSEEEALRLQLTSTETVLENNEYRNQLLGDAIELEAFFQRRVDELDAKDALAMSQVQYAPVAVQQETKERLAELAAPVRKLLAAMDADRVHRLLEIRNSKRYVDRLSTSIKQHLQVAEKLKGSIQDLHTKRKETDTLLKEQYPQLEQLQVRVKDVRGKVEAALSKLYDGRTVTLFDS